MHPVVGAESTSSVLDCGTSVPTGLRLGSCPGAHPTTPCHSCRRLPGSVEQSPGPSSCLRVPFLCCLPSRTLCPRPSSPTSQEFSQMLHCKPKGQGSRGVLMFGPLKRPRPVGWPLMEGLAGAKTQPPTPPHRTLSCPAPAQVVRSRQGRALAGLWVGESWGPRRRCACLVLPTSQVPRGPDSLLTARWQGAGWAGTPGPVGSAPRRRSAPPPPPRPLPPAPSCPCPSAARRRGG